MSAQLQPAVDADSGEFWSALKRGELRLQYGRTANRWQFPPLEVCRHTGERLEWWIVGTGGSIFSYIIQHSPVADGFEALLPYVIALVELDDAPGVRLPLRIEGSNGDGVVIGDRVRVEIMAMPNSEIDIAVGRLEHV